VTVAYSSLIYSRIPLHYLLSSCAIVFGIALASVSLKNPLPNITSYDISVMGMYGPTNSQGTLLPKLLAGAGIPFGAVVLPKALGVTSFVGFDFGTVQYFWLPAKLEQSGASRPSFLNNIQSLKVFRDGE
jgi:hypothetical protein